MNDSEGTQQPNLNMEAVNALRSRDRLAATPTPKEQKTNTPSNSTKQKVKNLLAAGNSLGILFKLILGIAFAVFLLLGLYALSLLTSLDTNIIKLTLIGRVVDQIEEPVENAVIQLGELSTRTDANGLFTFEGLDLTRYQLVIQANGYLERTQEISMSRGFFDYTNHRQFQIQAADDSSVTGKLIPEGQNYLFLDESIEVDDQIYAVSADGTFSIVELETGVHLLKINSVNFVDSEVSFVTEPGANDLGEIKLKPAGDIVGEVKSWITEDVLSEVKINVDNVISADIEIEAELFRIRDLEIGKEYTIRSLLQGYQTRDYKITIVQGENQLFGFKIVETGFIPFLRTVDKRLQVLASHFDGENEIILTTGKTEPYGEYVEGTSVYYLSTRDSVKSELGGDALIPYVVSTSGGFPQRLMEDTTNLGQIIPNWKAKKLINITSGTESGSRILQVLDLSGNNRVSIREIEDGVFTDAALSDDGKIVYYYLQDKTESQDGLYRNEITNASNQKLLNKSNLQIYDVSSNGDRILYTATNSTTGLSDLFLYTVSTAQDKTLRKSFSGSQYQFWAESDSLVVFHDFRDGGSNAYLLKIDENEEQILTRFKNTEGIEAIYQQNGYLVYQTNKGLYLMDVLNPKLGKLVTKNFERYTGYDF